MGIFESYSLGFDARSLSKMKGQNVDLRDVYAQESLANAEFDLLFKEIPFTVQNANRAKNNISEQIQTCVKSLNKTGIGFFLLPGFHLTFSNSDLEKSLRSSGWFVNAVFNLPKRFLEPVTMLRPILVAVSMSDTPQCLFAEFESWDGDDYGQFSILTDNLLNLIQQNRKALIKSVNKDPTFVEEFELEELFDEDLWMGTYGEVSKFKGFENLAIESEINSTSSDYHSFEKLKVVDVCSDIKLYNKNAPFEDTEESIFVPMLQGQKCCLKASEISIKHQNFIQIFLLCEIVLPEYMVVFLNSRIGEMVLNSARSVGGGIIPRLNRKKLESVDVFLPTKSAQTKICETQKMITNIFNRVTEIRDNFSLNPITAKDTDKLELIMRAMSEYTEQDKVRELIKRGEGANIEFKSTLHLDLKTRQKNKALEHECLKTVAGFLNARGGTLLIGVDDDGKILGVDEETEKFHKSEDKYKLHLKNLIKREIGDVSLTLVQFNLVDLDGAKVCVVECSPSDREVFINQTDFYLRTNPSTERLVGPSLIDYIRKRFKSE